MKPAPVAYHRPDGVAAALELLAELGDDGKVLAGGQSLLPLMNLRLAAPAALVDVGALAALRGVTLEPGGWLAIGAVTRQRAAERDGRVAAGWPLLAEALPWVGHTAIRNRGTVGGSVAHADPAAELPVALTALDAEVVLERAGGRTRSVPAAAFFTGYLSTVAAPEELVTAVRVPPVPAGTGQAWLELAPRHGDFAVVAVAATLRLAVDGTVAASRLVYGGVGPVPFVAADAAGALVGERPGDVAFRAAAAAAAAACAPADDLLGSAAYRRRLVRALTVRALRRAAERAATAVRPVPQAGVPDEGERAAPEPAAAGTIRGTSATRMSVTVEVNGVTHVRDVDARRTLADLLREDLRLTGTHLGCEHGVCGACTVQVDGASARSCLLLAAQADGARVRTVEGLAAADGALHPVQQAFTDCHGLQCGFCTPGFLMAVEELLREAAGPTEADVRAALSGNLCRCTGYDGIVDAVLAADRTWDRDLAAPLDVPTEGSSRP